AMFAFLESRFQIFPSTWAGDKPTQLDACRFGSRRTAARNDSLVLTSTKGNDHVFKFITARAPPGSCRGSAARCIHRRGRPRFARDAIGGGCRKRVHPRFYGPGPAARAR